MKSLLIRSAAAHMAAFLMMVVGCGFAAEAQATKPQRICDVTDYGAIGDDETLNTEAFNDAIDACAAAGGGQVLVPAGDFLTGSIVLKNNITLKIADGGRIVGTDSLSAYRYLDPRHGRISAKLQQGHGRLKSGDGRWHRALILGNDVENVQIIGSGVIDGRDVYDPKGEAGMRGPHTILIGDSRNLTVRGVHVTRSANYAIFFRGCENVVVEEVKVTGGWDAVHFRAYVGKPDFRKSNRNLRIIDNEFYTGDDAIAGRYVEGLHIENNHINTSCNGIRIIGPVDGMIVRNNVFQGPGQYPHRAQNRTNMLAGILLQPGAWGPSPGELKDVTITDVTMENVTAPIQIYLKRASNTADNILVKDLKATGVYRGALSIESWSDQAVGDVRFEDVQIEYSYEEDAKKRENYQATRPHVGARPLPAWGVYAKDVDTLTFDDVAMRTVERDPRPATIFEAVSNLDRRGLSLHSPER